jgi:hypothetical protein
MATSPVRSYHFCILKLFFSSSVNAPIPCLFISL